jgi:leucyl-tRNA synthetase
MSYNFTTIEKKWQNYWLSNKTFAALDPADAGGMPKAYILDMFPYPSGSGLHVGHPEGYTATDIISRFRRMQGYNVLHPMGWDAFGLPAEQYAVKTNTHPRVTTEQNIQNFRRQIQMLGLSYDWDREVDTTDPGYYKWTQWIFLQLFNSYFDPILNRAMPITHLMAELLNEALVIGPDNSLHINPTTDGMESVAGEVRIERLWRELTPEEQREAIDAQRLAYVDEVPVNWCPQLGTVLANEEVIDGKSEVGGFAVERRPMRQWMLRITAYADRLVDDLSLLDWPESLKEMQRNWIGKSIGAEVDFDIAPADSHAAAMQKPGDAAEDLEDDLSITVFTTRPDTLFGATCMVLAPEHPLVDRITVPSHRETIEAYRTMIAGKSDRDRMMDSKDKTGVFTGAFAINPATKGTFPVYIADYVLMGYGTGAIMAVPAHDERDYAFAKQNKLPITAVVMPDEPWLVKHRREGAAAEQLQATYKSQADGFDAAFTDEGLCINSDFLNGLPTQQAKEKMILWLEDEGVGHRSIKYKLRDWLFSRQRYWGEPFPLLLDAEGNAYAIDESELPLTLPELEDFKPTGSPEGPLSKAKDWLNVKTDRGEFIRETNTMPQWAGSCWYYLRYTDPKNTEQFVDPVKEKYWMPVDLYIGGVEHAVLHLLYSRFWHKVLFDLGHVSSPEPFRRLVNQGLILGEMEYTLFRTTGGAEVDAQEVTEISEEASAEGIQLIGRHKTSGERVLGEAVDPDRVVKQSDGHRLAESDAKSARLDARCSKMSKSRGNVVNPDEIVADYGADAFRLYEMYMGPLESPKPWNTRDIVGMSRFLRSVWRHLIGDDETATGSRAASEPIPESLDRQMHKTIKKVAEDIESLRFNTAIAELIKLNNELTALPSIPRELAENLTLMLAPFAPHIAEEIWERLGHHKTLARRPWPSYDPAKLVESTMELPVQVNGRLRDKITVAVDAAEIDILTAAENAEKVKPWMEGKTLRKKLYVPNKLVNFVVS